MDDNNNVIIKNNNNKNKYIKTIKYKNEINIVYNTENKGRQKIFEKIMQITQN